LLLSIRAGDSFDPRYFNRYALFFSGYSAKKLDKPEQEARQRQRFDSGQSIEMTVRRALSIALMLLLAIGLPCAAAERAYLYEESPNKQRGERSVGSVTWRTEMLQVSPVGPPELAILCDVVVPKRRMTTRLSLRRNTDKSRSASHSVEIQFVLPPDFPGGGIQQVLGLSMKQTEQAASAPLSGLTQKINPDSFLIELSAAKTDLLRNMLLLKERSWFDIPVVYDRGRRAILAIEKGISGQRAFAEVFAVWSKPPNEKASEDEIVQIQPQISKNSARDLWLDLLRPNALGGKADTFQK